ncbi:MAG: glycosyltransferase [Pirellulales bacterium]
MQNKLRIALLIHSLDGGGAERVMSQLANRWTQQHQVDLITWSLPESDRYAVEPSVQRHSLGLQKPSSNLVSGILANYRRVQAVRKKLIELSPDFVLSFCDQMNIVTLQAARRLKKTCRVWIAEHSDPQQQQLSRFWEAWRRRTYPRCTGCVALTDSIADYMTRWIPRDNLKVIPSALHDCPENVDYQAESGTTNTILYVGRLSPEKRIELLLESWRIAAPELPDWQLRIVGDGVARADLEQQAKGLPRVTFVGWKGNPQEEFVSSQMFVLCSRYEGFPVALLEALSFGLPVVTTACSSAIGELQATNYNEFIKVAVPDTPESIAEAIIELANDPARRINLSHQAHQVARLYTWATIGPKWDELLDTE